jgi:hypothetical protein
VSVDLDLVFVDHTLPGAEALASINDAMRANSGTAKGTGTPTRTTASTSARETKLLMQRGIIEVKVEVNYVMRGTVSPVRTANLMPNAQEALLIDLEIPVVSLSMLDCKTSNYRATEGERPQTYAKRYDRQ